MAYREAKTPGSRGKVLDHIRVHEGEDGGHMVEHHYAEDGMVYHKPKQHFFGADEGKDMMDHIRKHMHVKEEEPGVDIGAEHDAEREEEEA